MKKRSYAVFAIAVTAIFLLSMIVSETTLAAPVTSHNNDNRGKDHYNKPKHPHKVCHFVKVCHWDKVRWKKVHDKWLFKWVRHCEWKRVCRNIWY